MHDDTAAETAKSPIHGPALADVAVVVTMIALVVGLLILSLTAVFSR